jgi:cupin 2 domain-containing protein
MNLFDIPKHAEAEIVTSLIIASNLRVERIVSYGQCSPDHFWYDQAENEWVIVLKGSARLIFEDRTVRLYPGDYLNIPAHSRHRVEWTATDEPTIWLAIFYH